MRENIKTIFAGNIYYIINRYLRKNKIVNFILSYFIKDFNTVKIKKFTIIKNKITVGLSYKKDKNKFRIGDIIEFQTHRCQANAFACLVGFYGNDLLLESNYPINIIADTIKIMSNASKTKKKSQLVDRENNRILILN